MKKSNLLVLGASLVLGLASCGNKGGIDYNKVYLTGKTEIGGLTCRIDFYLKPENKALFDFTVEGDIPEGMPDFNTMMDMNGTYEVKGKDYVFTFETTTKEGEKKNVEYTAAYVEGKDYTHETKYVVMSDLGPKESLITGNLPL